VELFSKEGVKATHNREIANLSHTTPAMVAYYFKNRDNLIDTVVKERIIPMFLNTWKINWQADEREVLLELHRGIMKTAAANPFFLPLWSREIVNESGCLRIPLIKNMKQLAAQHTDTPSVFSILAECVRRGQKKGYINKDIVPEMVFMNLVGSTLVLLLMKDVWATAFDLKAGDEAAVKHIQTSILRGILA
jgi:AcrR family transcriptional regulator